MSAVLLAAANRLGLKFRYTNPNDASTKALSSTTLTGLMDPLSTTEKLLKISPEQANESDGEIGAAGGVVATSIDGGGGPGHGTATAKACGATLVKAQHSVKTT